MDISVGTWTSYLAAPGPASEASLCKSKNFFARMFAYRGSLSSALGGLSNRFFFQFCALSEKAIVLARDLAQASWLHTMQYDLLNKSIGIGPLTSAGSDMQTFRKSSFSIRLSE